MKTFKFILLCGVVLGALQSPAAQWVSTGDMGATHFGYGMVTLQDGRALATSARAGSIRELFDPATGSWVAAGGTNYERYWSDAVVMPDGRVLTVGGLYSSAGHSAEIWDPAVQAWRSTSSMSSERNLIGLTVLRDGTVLAAGGWLQTTGVRSAEIFDPAGETWTPTGDMLRPHVTAGKLVTLPDGRAFVAATNSEIYNPSTHVWSASGNMHSPRLSYTATLLGDGRVMVTGGDMTFRGVEIFDPTTETWTVAASMPRARFEHRAALLPDGRVLVAGGAGGPGKEFFLNSTDIYDPATNTWSAGPDMNLQRADFLITALNGGILVAGGLISITCTDDCYWNYTNTAEIFYP